MWRHPQKYKDWNLAADEIACDALLDLLDRMENAKWPSQMSLRLAKTSMTATGGADRKARFAREFTLKYRKGIVPDDCWELSDMDGVVTLVLGLTHLRAFRDAVADMKNGGGDYCIGDDDAPVWVWWLWSSHFGACLLKYADQQ